MIYGLYHNHKIVYKRACRDLTTFKKYFYKKKSKIFKNEHYDDYNQNFCKLFNKRFERIIDGWEIRTYRNYKSVLPTVASNRIQTRRKKKPAANYFYVFDIETTNYKNKYAFSYLYGIKKYNYRLVFEVFSGRKLFTDGKIRFSFGRRCFKFTIIHYTTDHRYCLTMMQL